MKRFRLISEYQCATDRPLLRSGRARPGGHFRGQRTRSCNVFAGETWAQVKSMSRTHVRAVANTSRCYVRVGTTQAKVQRTRSFNERARCNVSAHATCMQEQRKRRCNSCAGVMYAQFQRTRWYNVRGSSTYTQIQPKQCLLLMNMPTCISIMLINYIILSSF